MELKDQVCTLDQAKRLKELGVDGETLFYWWVPTHGNPFIDRDDSYDQITTRYPAYTVAELGLMLPRIISNEKTVHGLWCAPSNIYGESTIKYHIAFKRTLVELFAKTEAEARAAMLIHLLENNYITAEHINIHD